jgi:uncharacterized protein (TIGR02246 family)
MRADASDHDIFVSDEAAIRALHRQILEGWNARDADAFAAPFAEDGAVIGFDGSQQSGRGEIAATTRCIFADHLTATYVWKVRAVRPLAPGAAYLHAVVGMVPRGQTDLNPAVNAHQTVIAAKRGDQWQVLFFQNTPAQFHGRPDLAEQLTAELRQLLLPPSPAV